jgi:phenylalanyl-tRNA synthetase beta chain
MDYLGFLGKNIDITGYAEYLDEKRVNHIVLNVSYDFINTKAGITIPEEKVKEILQNLGFIFSEKDKILTITVPSWRASKDISIKEDIAEEVSRIY